MNSPLTQADLKLNGEILRIHPPYRDVVRALTRAEHAELRDSIRTHGVRTPILVDHLGRIVDGHHRVAIAEELGITLTSADILEDAEDLTEAQIEAIALDLNSCRRSMTPAERRQVILDRAKADVPTKDIAAEADCTVSNVARVLKEAGLSRPTGSPKLGDGPAQAEHLIKTTQMTNPEIAAETGYTGEGVALIRQRLFAAGEIPEIIDGRSTKATTPATPKVPDPKALAEELLSQGQSIDQITEATGLAAALVRRLRQSYREAQALEMIKTGSSIQTASLATGARPRALVACVEKAIKKWTLRDAPPEIRQARREPIFKDMANRVAAIGAPDNALLLDPAQYVQALSPFELRSAATQVVQALARIEALQEAINRRLDPGVTLEPDQGPFHSLQPITRHSKEENGTPNLPSTPDRKDKSDASDDPSTSA